jgi:hypothetical protein
MPTISRFLGIRILMFHDEHPRPHFHARYAESEASVALDKLEVIAGNLPRRVLALVLEWALLHRPELVENRSRAGRHEPLARIPGLDEEA